MPADLRLLRSDPWPTAPRRCPWGAAVRVLKGLALTGLALAGLAQGARADELQPFEVSYEVTWHGVPVAQSVLTLVHGNAGTWVYSEKNKVTGLLRLFATVIQASESVMRVTDAGVQPLTYKVLTADTPAPNDVNLTFDWHAGHVTGQYESSPIDLPVPQGTQDGLSVQIALVFELIRGRSPQEVTVLDGTSTRQYTYTREQDEVLDTKMGRIATVIYKSSKVNSAKVTRLWCAPEFGYVPMRVEQRTEDGKVFEVLVQSTRRL